MRRKRLKFEVDEDGNAVLPTERINWNGNRNKNGKNKVGRPSAYRSEFAKQAEKLCKLGATDMELADFFAVSRTTLMSWATEFPEFFNALKLGKDAFDDRVERSLALRAIGYTYEAVEYYIVNKEIVAQDVRKHVPPDTVACIFWLKNRRPEQWRDRHEHTGRDGAPISVEYRQAFERSIDGIVSRRQLQYNGGEDPQLN